MSHQREVRPHAGLYLLCLCWMMGAGLLVGCGESDAPARRPNLILITLDTFRADVLSAYGGREGLTPWLDQFAREAVVFDRATAPIGTTFPSHASLFTGLYPSRHGVRSNADGLADRFTTLAETLRASGYETAAFSSMPTILTRGGLSQGFEVSNGESAESGKFLLDGEDVNRHALSWLEETNPDPFLLWLHYSETHSPYRLTSHARSRFEETRYEGPLSEGATTDVFYSLGRDLAWRRPGVRSAHRRKSSQAQQSAPAVRGADAWAAKGSMLSRPDPEEP